MKIHAVLTDIEGTTSAISFVHDVLFPYAREHLPAFVRRESGRPDVAAILEDVRCEAGEPDADVDRIIEILQSWIVADRKVTPLKDLQGIIWTNGYVQGDFLGHVYDDAAREMRRWHKAGLPIYIYSSGSVTAQKLLFSYSAAGDLTPLFSDYFDTRIGNKKEQASYNRIAAEIGESAGNILFLSDVVAELDAARDAGMQTIQLVRSDDVVSGTHVIASDFSDVANHLLPEDGAADDTAPTPARGAIP